MHYSQVLIINNYLDIVGTEPLDWLYCLSVPTHLQLLHTWRCIPCGLLPLVMMVRKRIHIIASYLSDIHGLYLSSGGLDFPLHDIGIALSVTGAFVLPISLFYYPAV